MLLSLALKERNDFKTSGITIFYIWDIHQYILLDNSLLSVVSPYILIKKGPHPRCYVTKQLIKLSHGFQSEGFF